MNYILIFFFIIFVNMFCYKIIRKIDKKEREKLYKWEDEQIEKLSTKELENIFQKIDRKIIEKRLEEVRKNESN